MATAFCIYSADDYSLNFYKRDTVPAVGDTFEGKAVTKIWTGFETTAYTDSNHPDWQKDGTNKLVQTVTFVDTIKPKSLDGWFRDGHNIISFDLAKLDTSNCTNMGYVFRDCYAITELDVSNFNTSKVTNMKSMFYNLNNLEELDVSNFNTSLVVYMNFMFYACLQCNIIGLENFDTKNCTNMQSMLYKCAGTNNFNLSSWDTSKVTNMAYLFTNAGGNVNLDGWNTTKVTTMQSMFAGSFFTYLDLSSFDLSSITTANSMFFNNTVLRTIAVSHNWNERIPETADTYWMFENCYSLMGDVAYLDIVDINKPLEEIYLLMTGTYATTNGGYLTMKLETPEEDEGDGEIATDNNVYMVLGSTLSDIANSMRKITGTPTKIALKNFSKILEKQVNSVDSAKIMVKDKRYVNDDVTYVGFIYYTNTNFTSMHKDITRFVVVPDIIKGSIIHFEDMASLEDGLGVMTCNGDIQQLSDTTFLVNGDGTVELVLASSIVEEPMMMSMRRMSAPAPKASQRIIHDEDNGEEVVE